MDIEIIWVKGLGLGRLSGLREHDDFHLPFCSGIGESIERVRPSILGGFLVPTEALRCISLASS